MHRNRTPDDYEEAFISCISRTNKEISFKKKTGLFQFTNFLERSIKKLALFLERGITFRANSRTGLSIWGNFFLERGVNLKSRAAHTHPKNTQVLPRAPMP